MAYQHADAYESIDACEIIACADIVKENAETFAAEYGVADTHVYEDHAAMVSEVDPNIVSVAVPPTAHAEIAIDCTRHPPVCAVHCKKPMALILSAVTVSRYSRPRGRKILYRLTADSMTSCSRSMTTHWRRWSNPATYSRTRPRARGSSHGTRPGQNAVSV